MSAGMREKVGILVGGGPAPGINSVIAAATIRSVIAGWDVIGILDGFQWIMDGDTEHVMPLDIERVSRLHFHGGSELGTSRANPTRSEELLDIALASLEKMEIGQLITIGGDDTAISAMRLADRSHGRLRVVHVPKTIDNDLDLPAPVDTFGYQTARSVGVQIVENLMVDARTTGRWYFLIAMGRNTGHLALGIGKAAGATVTLIPEEFGPDPTPLAEIADTLVGSIITGLARGRRDGVAIIAEGVVYGIDPDDLTGLDNVERDDHGHLRLAEVDIGALLKREVRSRLSDLGLQVTVVSKNIGYELRCADPNPFDLEYTRELGYAAAKYLSQGGHAAMVSIQGGHFVPVPFAEMLDPDTGRARVRYVDINAVRYRVARRYMLRLRQSDFDSPERVGKLAAAANLTVEAFRDRFGRLPRREPPPLDFMAGEG